MKDIAPELQAKIEKTFRDNLQSNKRIQQLKAMLDAEKPNYSAADQYALEVGQALADAFHKHVTADILPDGKMYYNIAERIIPPSCRVSYEEISGYAETIVRGMNQRAGIGIAPQRAPFNTDRVKGLVERACGAEQYEDIRKSFEGDLVNYAQSVSTETMTENAEFGWKAGMNPVIRRIASADCCDWCAALDGEYAYEDVQDTGNDVYRRHRDCRCEISYDPGGSHVQNVHTKRWTPKNIDLGVKPTIM